MTSRSNQHDTDLFLMKALTLYHSVTKKQKGVCASDVSRGAGETGSFRGGDGFFCSILHLRDFPGKQETPPTKQQLYSGLQTAFPTRTNILQDSIASQCCHNGTELPAHVPLRSQSQPDHNKDKQRGKELVEDTGRNPWAQGIPYLNTVVGLQKAIREMKTPCP